MTEEQEQKKQKRKKKPTIWGVAGYAAVIVILGLLAIFSRQLAQVIKGPVLCIYVGVLPKYIFGLALILAGVDGIVYTIRFFREDAVIPMIASGIQALLLVVFIFLIFPLALREGVPPGSTYNIMRVLIGIMFLVTLWDFISEFREYRKLNRQSS
jgi:hypothetical protein